MEDKVYIPKPTIRQLTITDLEDYRAIRLEALERARGNFSSTHERETAMTDEQWRIRLSDPNGALFGVYVTDSIVGVTGIVVDRQKLQQDNVRHGILVQSYLRELWRGKGLARLLYSARLDWAREQGLARVLVGHREDNLASRACILRHGFKATHKEMISWPDGAQLSLCHYALDLLK